MNCLSLLSSICYLQSLKIYNDIISVSFFIYIYIILLEMYIIWISWLIRIRGVFKEIKLRETHRKISAFFNLIILFIFIFFNSFSHSYITSHYILTFFRNKILILNAMIKYDRISINSSKKKQTNTRSKKMKRTGSRKIYHERSSNGIISIRIKATSSLEGSIGSVWSR